MKRRDWLDCALIIVITYALYALTLLPGVGEADTAEFQRVIPTRELAHPTGYPLYSLLGWLWVQLPLGTPAWELNLLSALFGALAVGLLYLAGLQTQLSRPVAAAAALTFAASLTFWAQATRAEVYALALLLQALLLQALLLWRAGRLPLWAVGLAVGLGLAHHRTITLLLPGAALFVLWPAGARRRPRLGEIALAVAAAAAPLLFYLDILLRIPPWADRWPFFTRYTLAGDTSVFFSPARLLDEGLARPLHLVRAYVWGQFLVLGVPLQLLGAARLIRRDRPLAILLLLGVLIVFAFCSASFVPDVDVFLLPLYALGALLLGHGLAALLAVLPARAGWLALALPLLLGVSNVSALRGINSAAGEQSARALMASPLPDRSLVVGDWSRIEALRYLQVIEGQHPTVELLLTFDPPSTQGKVREALSAGRAVYLLAPSPGLGLHQHVEGALWRVEDRPIAIAPETPSGAAWETGIRLERLTLPPGPYRPGESVPLAAEWGATSDQRESFTLFIHLLDESGELRGQQDRTPTPPTEQWRAGQLHRDLYAPQLSLDAPPGRYRVLVGWYRFPSLDRLALDAPGGDVERYAVIGEIDVVR